MDILNIRQNRNNVNTICKAHHGTGDIRRDKNTFGNVSVFSATFQPSGSCIAV